MDENELKRLLGIDVDVSEKFEVSSYEETETDFDRRYQYSYVDLDEVIANPNEYIIPLCQPACRALWDKNIETFMVSNNDDSDLYVLLAGLSSGNKAILEEKMKSDSRYFFSSYRNTFGISVGERTEEGMKELESLTDIFKIQDTFRFKSDEDFLREYKTSGGELFVTDDGTIHFKENPDLANITLEEALEKTGKRHLYVAEEGRVYESPMYLKWHRRYQHCLQNPVFANITEDVSSPATLVGEFVSDDTLYKVM